MPSHNELANALRVLSIDAVQQANSGHPGAPMGMADMAEILWNDFLHHNPANPNWLNRDRFVLSNGHASALVYSLLHLTGYDVSIEDLKQFRQLHSKTPGHPEYGITPGIETTTGPLGQGLANAVGMALGERTLAAQFNQPGHTIIDHYTYVFVGDGCLMEGISHEVCSLAGTLNLGKLIVFWDDNGISIDGKVASWFDENVAMRFKAYGWHVIEAVDGHDADAIAKAIEVAQQTMGQPSLICCRTVIGQGAPNVAGTHHCHGAPLGDAEIAATREKLDWSDNKRFSIPDTIVKAWNAKEKGKKLEDAWREQFSAYQQAYPELAQVLLRREQGELPTDWQSANQKYIQQLQQESPKLATRQSSQKCLAHFAKLLPELVGGSADLTGSNGTRWQEAKTLSAEQYNGNYLHYGVREFGMSAIMNGLALYGGFIPFGGTFLTFTDYARNAVRMAALMNQRVIFVYTHDSIGLGEDGPTHQPIEHITMLRATPNLAVWRPCDAVETAVAWQQALENKTGPSCLLLTRQAVQPQKRDQQTLADCAKGGYILTDCEGTTEAIILATGSEVELAQTAAQQLTEQGHNIRVVSLPSTEVFEQQDSAYKQSVLPDNVRARVAIEAGATHCWYKYVGMDGKVIGIDRFGESAPAQQIYQELGITADAVMDAVKELL